MQMKLIKQDRDITLDLMKTLLVLGMITAHVFQLCYSGGSKCIEAFSFFINIVTFSSFMFCFGCSSQLAYLGKYKNRTAVKQKLGKNFMRLLVCFYISGYAYLEFVGNGINMPDFFKVLLLWRIPGYSEFLLSFAMLNIVVYASFNTLQQASVNKCKTGGVILISLIATFIPYKFILIPIIGTFIGTTKFACFPILQYLPFFLIGIYCQRNKAFFTKGLLAATFLITMAISCLVAYTHDIPKRFPPSLPWILWPSFLTLAYYWISNRLGNIVKNSWMKIFIDVFGAYTLDYLVISNVLIFITRKIYNNNMSIEMSLAFTFLLFAICFLYGLIKMKRKNRLYSQKR